MAKKSTMDLLTDFDLLSQSREKKKPVVKKKPIQAPQAKKVKTNGT